MRTLRKSTLKFVLGIGCLVLICAGLSLARTPSRRQVASVVGCWRLVRIDSGDPDGQQPGVAPPTGLLIYTREGYASVQLMYAQTTLSNEFVHDGYEATFGTYEVDARKHQLTYHIQGSATRDLLVGKIETLIYEFPDDRHMTIRPSNPDQRWHVTWQRY